MYREGKPEQEFIDSNKFMKEKVQEKSKDCIKIDKSYLEAAKDLGATPAKAFIKVTLPLSKAGIISGVSMVFLPSMTNYVVSNYMTFNHTKIIGAFIDECFRNDLWNLGSVTALLLLTLMFLMTWLTGGFNTESDTQSRGTSLW